MDYEIILSCPESVKHDYVETYTYNCAVKLLMEHQQLKEADKKLAQAAAEFLGGYLE